MSDLNLLLADSRQALFDAVKVDEGASVALRHEIGRAIGLMGQAMDALKVAPELHEALEECVRLMWADNPADGWADAIAAGRAALSKSHLEQTRHDK